MTICSVCKDPNYEGYTLFFCDKIESVGFEFSLRELYYNQKKNEGLCSGCRDKLMKDDVWVWRHWLLVRARIMCIQSEQKGGDKIKWTKALKRIDGFDKKLEQTKAVQKIIAQNKKSMEAGEDYGYF